jgi:hypothetical protein
MKKLFFFIAILATTFSLTAANAQVRQHRRIHQGVKSGEITRAERIRIAKQKQDVREAVRDSKADGVITQAEKQEIRKQKRQVNRTIYRTKHNEKRRNN